MANNYKRFHALLSKSKTEEEVKHAYAKDFNLDYKTEFHHDLYCPEVFFEFKFQRNLKKLENRATVLAQVLYYIRRLRFEHADKVVPPVICIADSRDAFFSTTKSWSKFFESTSKYDWDIAPSTPDVNLVSDIAAHSETHGIKVYDVLYETEYTHFSQRLKDSLSKQLTLDFRIKKLITEENFEEVFDYWNKCFGDLVRNGTKPSRYFLCDIQAGRSLYDKKENKVIFLIGPEERKTKNILPAQYEWFWDNFEKVSDVSTIRNIVSKVDRLTDVSIRRFTGEFFTPVPFTRKAHACIERAIGKNWWTKNYRLWDMASGTGNLEWLLPADAYKSVYMSTLHQEDVEHCRRLFPGSTVFQYDYLNDDVDNVFNLHPLLSDAYKLPQNLREDLANSEIKWIVFINPPFATSQKAGYSGNSKESVSNTGIRKLMHGLQLGEVSRELFAQFLFRIRHEFKERQTHLGLFSTLKYVNSNNDQKFRDNLFQFAFKEGFIFSSANFSGVQKANPFPVGFLVWNLAKRKKLDEQRIEVAVLDEDTFRIGHKLLVSEHRNRFLSKWIERPSATEIRPPLGSAIKVKSGNMDVRNRVAKGFLASLMCKGNDVQNQNNVALLSGPYVSAGALSVIPENFDHAMIVHAVRKSVIKSWMNDRDQFLQPRKAPGLPMIHASTIWSLFSSSNHTASLRNVNYNGTLYQIQNHFFPFMTSDVKSWEITDSDIKKSLQTDPADRFVALWLASQKLDSNSLELITLGKEIYKSFFKNFKHLPTAKFKIEHWDAGWWQIRSCLTQAGLASELFQAMQPLLNILRERILTFARELEIISAR